MNGERKVPSEMDWRDELDDPFLRMLETRPYVRKWLAYEMSGEQSGTRTHTCNLPAMNLCSTGEYERPLFNIPVSINRFPDDRQLCAVLGSYGVVPKSPRKRALEVSNSNAVESAHAFYLPSDVTLDGWGMGRVIATDWSSMGLAAMLGYELCEGFQLVAGRYVSSQKTGEHFEILLVKDGRVIVLHNMQLATRFTVRIYAPRGPDGKWGKVERMMCMTSLLDCKKCCGDGSRRATFCRCECPDLPEPQHEFASWGDVQQMSIDRVQDALHLNVIYDPQRTVLASYISYRRASLVRATRDTLPIFQALVVGNDGFRPHVETSIFGSMSSRSAFSRSPSSLSSVPMAANARSANFLHDAADCEPDMRTTRVKLVTCVDGEGTASSSGGLQNSRAEARGRGEYQCQICARRFTVRHNLKRHMVTVHAETRKHGCEECGMLFKTKNHLTLHVRQVHQGERSHACHLCPARFWSPSNLKRHVNQAHHSVRLFPCDRCGKRFSSKYNLDRHITNVCGVANVADGSKVQFPTDGATAAESSVMAGVAQMREQNGKVFSCEICRKSFSSKFNLDRHLANRHYSDRGSVKRENLSKHRHQLN